MTFFKPRGVGSIEAVTFERGVEDFTKACGTGAIAAALVQMENFGFGAYHVKMPGGTLRVEALSSQEKVMGSGHKVFLTGPTQFDFEIRLVHSLIHQESK